MAETLIATNSRSPEHQLALQLFNDLAPASKTIADANSDVGFSISQVLVDVKDLSVVARKALIGCYFLAATSPTSPSGTYDFDLGFFKWLINYSSSNNLAHLKKVLTEAQKSAIQVNIIDADKPSKDKWASVPLMGVVAIQGGRIMFSLPTQLISELSNPGGIMMYLSLRIQANFTSVYAQTLFAKVVPLKNDGVTPWMTLSEFSNWMNIAQYDWAKEYRYLNRDVIKVAIDQINAHSDITLTPETKTAKGSRKIEFLRFVIEQKASDNSWANSMSGFATEKEIYDILNDEFLMAPGDLDKIKANRSVWTNEKLWDAITFTRVRMQNTKLEFLRKPGNYFLDALKKGYRVVSPAQKQAEKADTEFERQQRAKVQEKVIEDEKKILEEQAKAAMDAFESLPGEIQNELWARFEHSPAKSMIKSVQKKENAGEPLSRGELMKSAKIYKGFCFTIVKPYLDSVAVN